MKYEILVCYCSSVEHQIVFTVDEEDNLIYAHIHLMHGRSFISRLIAGIKYIFGHRSIYGHWDELLLTKEHIDTLAKAATKLK